MGNVALNARGSLTLCREFDMRIDEARGCVTFDRLVRADRSLGSDEAITMHKPAEKAVAVNAMGVFASRSLVEINASARTCGTELRKALLAS